MPTFTVSAPPGGPVTLSGNTGTLAFMVTNTAARATTGTVVVKPEAPAALDWFAVSGAQTRTFQPGGVEQIAVTITVPAGTPAATYSLRLDAKSEENPDEDYTEGPSAQFIVPAPPPTVPWWRRYWWIIAIVAVVLIGIVLAIILLSGDDSSAEVTPTPQPTATATATVTFPERHCIDYDPQAVRFQRTAGGIAIFAGRGRQALGIVDSERAGADAKRLAEAYTRFCRVGSGELTAVYWVGDTGAARPDTGGCVKYDPRALRIDPVQRGALTVFELKSEDILLGQLPTQEDAEELFEVAGASTKHCFIGRPISRAGTQIEYWE